MISQTAQYALRAVVCLAARPQSMTTGQLAEMTKVSAEYLSKVMQLLVKADIVTSKPGKMGGFALKVPPESLSLLQVVEAVDMMPAEVCSLEVQTYGNILRSLHRKLSQLNAQYRIECSKIYIKDLL